MQGQTVTTDSGEALGGAGPSNEPREELDAHQGLKGIMMPAILTRRRKSPEDQALDLV